MLIFMSCNPSDWVKHYPDCESHRLHGDERLCDLPVIASERWPGSMMAFLHMDRAGQTASCDVVWTLSCRPATEKT